MAHESDPYHIQLMHMFNMHYMEVFSSCGGDWSLSKQALISPTVWFVCGLFLLMVAHMRVQGSNAYFEM